MSGFARAVVLLLSLSGLCAWSGEALAAAKFARVAGNWSAAGTWSSVSCAAAGATAIPTAADDVTICNGINVTVDGAGTAGSVTIATGATATALTLGAAGTLTVTNAGGLSGNVIINPSTANVTRSLAVGARTLTVTGSVTINGGTTTGGASNISQLTVTTGTANLGSLVINAGTVNTSVARTTVTTGTINVTGDVTLTGGITSNTRDALLSVTGASAVGAGVNIGGALNIVSSLAGTSTVSITAAGGRITVNGAGGVNNEDTLTVAAGIFSVTNAAATLTTSDAAIVSTTSVTTGTLAIAGNAVVDSGAIGASSMTVTTGVITVGGTLGVTAATTGTNATGDATVSVTTGRISVTGNTTVTGGVAAGQLATLTVGASAVGNGVIIGGALNIVSSLAGTSTVSITNAAGRITVNGAVTNEDLLYVDAGIFNAATTLTTSDPAIVSLTRVTTGTLAIAGNAVVDSGAVGASSMTVTTGVITVGGTLGVTAATTGTNATGDATVSVTTGRISVTGNTTVTGGVATGQVATLTVTGAGAVGQGVNIGGTLNIVSSLAGTATVSSAATATSRITVGGNVTNGGTITVGAGIFTVTNAASTYSNSSAVVVATTTISTGTLSVAGHLTNGTAETITVTGAGIINVGGNWSNSGTFTAGTGTVTFNGAAQQTLTGATTFNNLTVNNAAGIVLANDITATSAAAGVVTLTSGAVTTGANTLIIPRSCATPSVTRTGGWVNGNLRKAIPAGASTCNFEVGDAGNYTPVSTTFVAGTTAGNLTASTVGTQHPSITDPSSNLETGKMVNRYWTLTNGGVGLPAAGYSATFNFINPGDLTGGSTPANFEVENWNGAAWSATAAGTRTASSTQANSLTAFGAFAVGEKKPPLAVVSINCSTSCAATSAATVSWTVVFNRSVTGVDATDFALAATGVSGAFITAVTGSGTTWTVTANTGIGSGTLGLNLVDDDTIVDAGGRKLGGTGLGNGNFTGEVYPITAAPALAEYRMDEASWNGTANEVADSSGSGNHAQAFNSANTEDVSRAIPGSPGTCRNGVFDNGTTITQGYVQTPLPNLTSDFTVTAWVRTTNNTVIGQRILIDDQGTAPATGYGFSLGDGAAGILRFYSHGITPVVFDSTYTIANNTWYFVAAVADITNKKRTIYVFDAAGALLNSTGEAAAFTGTWGTDGGPVTIGGTTDAAYHFKGNLDEVRVYQKVLSQAALTAIATQSHVCPIVIPDHLEIQSSGSGLTCAASTLTIKACTDAAIPCAVPYTLGVSGTLSASGPPPTVIWDGTTGGATGAGFVIPNGGSSVTKDVQVATAGTVTFGVAAATPAPTNATACNFGTNPGNNNCVFTADKAGFIFSDSATGNTAYTIPTLTSGAAQNTDNLLWLRAVQASTANAAVCTPAIIGQTVDVDMGYACNDPNTCQAGNLGVINGAAIAPAGTQVSLAFDANGSAKITTVRYDDVGEITLTANKTITPFGGATPVTLNGSSNAFVVKPAGFVLSNIKCTTVDAANCGAGALAMPTPGDNPGAANAAGVTFIRAGHPFAVTVTAKNALGNTTRNYGQETTAESVKLTSALVSGLGLTNNPAVSGTFGTFIDGVATGTAFIWNEVGIITLTPSVADADYLTKGDVTGTASGNVGRFYAAQFALSGGIIANRTGLGGICAVAGCDTFTYMGEQMSALFTLTAQAVDGTATLLNYNWSATPANNFAKFDPTAAGNPLALGAVDIGAPRTVANLDTTTFGVATGSFVNGVAAITAPFAVTRGALPSGPFDALEVGIAPVDGGDSTTLSAATLDLAVNAGGAPNTHGRIGSTRARYGRLKLFNAHGSELLPLPVNVTAQFWNGTTYLTNTLDNSSAFAAADVLFSNYRRNLAPGETSVVTPPASVTFANGIAGYRLAGPGAGNNGSVDMTVTSIISAYLPGNTARATFGVYKGNNEFIYLREAY